MVTQIKSLRGETNLAFFCCIILILKGTVYRRSDKRASRLIVLEKFFLYFVQKEVLSQRGIH